MGELTYIKGDYAEFPYWVNTRTAEGAFPLGVLYPASSPEVLADFSTDSIDDHLVTVRGSTTRMMANGSGARWVQGDLESDGRLAVVWTGEAVSSRFALAGGRYLRQADRFSVELSSAAAIAVEVDPEANSISVYLSEDPEISAKISVNGLSWEGPLKPGRQEISLARQ